MSEVKVGDRSLTIPRFTAFKVFRGGRIVASITKKYPAIMLEMAEFTNEYERKNSIRITRAMAKTPRFQAYGFGSKDFEPEGFVELPSSPTIYEQIMAVFPSIMEAAEGDVVTLVALCLAPNSELEEADENDQVDEYLNTKAKKLLHEAEADQFVDVVIAASEVLIEQFSKKFDEVGKLRALVDPTAAAAAAREAKTERSPESSIGSPAPMGGHTDGSSTEPLGVS